jgi:hypothetical protein
MTVDTDSDVVYIEDAQELDWLGSEAMSVEKCMLAHQPGWGGRGTANVGDAPRLWVGPKTTGTGLLDGGEMATQRGCWVHLPQQSSGCTGLSDWNGVSCTRQFKLTTGTLQQKSCMRKQGLYVGGGKRMESNYLDQTSEAWGAFIGAPSAADCNLDNQDLSWSATDGFGCSGGSPAALEPATCRRSERARDFDSCLRCSQRFSEATTSPRASSTARTSKASRTSTTSWMKGALIEPRLATRRATRELMRKEPRVLCRHVALLRCHPVWDHCWLEFHWCVAARSSWEALLCSAHRFYSCQVQSGNVRVLDCREASFRCGGQTFHAAAHIGPDVTSRRAHRT